MLLLMPLLAPPWGGLGVKGEFFVNLKPKHASRRIPAGFLEFRPRIRQLGDLSSTFLFTLKIFHISLVPHVIYVFDEGHIVYTYTYIYSMYT